MRTEKFIVKINELHDMRSLKENELFYRFFLRRDIISDKISIFNLHKCSENAFKRVLKLFENFQHLCNFLISRF